MIPTQEPRIVVLDAGHLLDGGLDWGDVARLGRLEVRDSTAPDEVRAHAAAAPVVLTNKTPLSAETIAALPDLRFIGVLATGYNVVDAAAARARGIPVSNVPAYGTESVAQHVFALILELCNRVGTHAAAVADDLARGLAAGGVADVVDLERDLAALEDALATQDLRTRGHDRPPRFVPVSGEAA